MAGRGDDPKLQQGRRLLVSGCLPCKASLSALLCAVLFFIFLVIPLKGKNKEMWSVGALSSQHTFLGSDCQSCHKEPFERVTNASCQSCHQVNDHPAFHPESRKSQDQCISCHHEHHGEQNLKIRADSLCTDCHASLSSKGERTDLRDVASFEEHPEIQKLSDPGTLVFNHRVHLKEQIQGPEGKEQLECSNCHHPQNDRKLFEKIRYERDCARCHPLTFDEGRPQTIAPHAPPQEVVDFLLGEYAKDDLFGTEVPRDLSDSDKGREERMLPRHAAFQATQEIAGRSRSSVIQKTREAEKALFTKTGCDLCHHISEIDSQGGKESDLGKFNRPVETFYEVKQPEVSDRWLIRANFDHRPHKSFSCDSCHKGVETSKISTDVLLPPMKECKDCHGVKRNEKGHGGLGSACITCHRYHGDDAGEGSASEIPSLGQER